jgi:eukaryotic-like serine/threonine-protein kinase
LRLPSEWEWEYACRGGTKTPFYFGSTVTIDQVNYAGNHPYREQEPKGGYRQRTVQITSMPHNACGLFEMHGNLWEWCSDSAGSSNRVLRGGCWYDSPQDCRSAFRIRLSPRFRRLNFGFRPSKSLK